MAKWTTGAQVIRQPSNAMESWLVETVRRHAEKAAAAEKTSGEAKVAEAVKNAEKALAEAKAECMVRDLVNAPPEDMGPAALEHECEKLAKAHKAELTVVRGDALERGYPMVHAVGRAAAKHRGQKQGRAGDQAGSQDGACCLLKNLHVDHPTVRRYCYCSRQSGPVPSRGKPRRPA